MTEEKKEPTPKSEETKAEETVKKPAQAEAAPAEESKSPSPSPESSGGTKQTEQLSEPDAEEADSADEEQSDAQDDIQSEEERLLDKAKSRADASQPTNKLDQRTSGTFPLAGQFAFGTRGGEAAMYIELPINASEKGISETAPRWRIELLDLGSGSGSLGIDIVGDIVIGRGNPPDGADLDLSPYKAAEKGVSRRHAMLRPTANHLYLIDLNSTNGTMHNATPLGKGIARSVRNNDSITLGRLTFTLKIIQGPKSAEESAAPKPNVEKKSPGDTKPFDAGL
ncbi:MAG: FHA domain-containing protein [Chloroflexi bacterium]|nr:FHA domain-containing protein [Chloroflexota bacterium]